MNILVCFYKLFGFVSNSIFSSVIMSNRNHNVYENLNLFEEIWEKKDERKEEKNKKEEKKQK